jgi:hypothetical protein
MSCVPCTGTSDECFILYSKKPQKDKAILVAGTYIAVVGSAEWWMVGNIEEKGLKQGKRRGGSEGREQVEDSRSGGWAADCSPSMTQSFYCILFTNSSDTAPRTPQTTAPSTALVHGPLVTSGHSSYNTSGHRTRDGSPLDSHLFLFVYRSLFCSLYSFSTSFLGLSTAAFTALSPWFLL